MNSLEASNYRTGLVNYQNYSSASYYVLNDLNLNSTALQDETNDQHYVDDSKMQNNHEIISKHGIYLQGHKQNQDLEDESKSTPFSHVDSNFFQCFAQTSKQSQNEFNSKCMSNNKKLESQLKKKSVRKNQIKSHSPSPMEINSSNSPKQEEIMIKFGKRLVKKGSELYYKLAEKRREALKRHREKKKIEKEIQEKLKKLANNLDTLKNMNEKIFTTYPNAKDQFAILDQRFIKLKTEVDSSELITSSSSLE
ncbi:unnamed protein product [Brachionus calyciflorus]|uniref:Uncharacterized protein n=1 Tax=Brachionus calyciflorus TaxID=104777 RepID=A0A813W4J4_9BILA|nr:unnamed protein product [Brachionus calyciflorus]